MVTNPNCNPTGGNGNGKLCKVEGHSGEPLLLFCGACRAPICARCLVAAQHVAHVSQVTPLSEHVAALQRRADALCVGELGDQASVSAEVSGAASAKTMTEGLRASLDRVAAQVQVLRATLLQAVNSRCDALQSEAQQLVQPALDSVADATSRMQQQHQECVSLGAKLQTTLQAFDIVEATRLGDQVEAAAEKQRALAAQIIQEQQRHQKAAATATAAGAVIELRQDRALLDGVLQQVNALCSVAVALSPLTTLPIPVPEIPPAPPLPPYRIIPGSPGASIPTPPTPPAPAPSPAALLPGLASPLPPSPVAIAVSVRA